MIFDEPTRRKLARLSLVASRARAGAHKGERRSTQHGSSVEFADYRDYVPGDDLRRLDWHIYARLDRPFIKLLEDEEDLAVHLLVDASRSMDWGEGESNKYRYAVRLAAALGLIGLASGDQLTLILLKAEGKAAQYGPARGGHHTLQRGGQPGQERLRGIRTGCQSPQGRRLDAAEAEVQPTVLHGDGKRHCRRVAGLSQPVERRPARIAQAHGPRDFVERLSGGVVARPAEHGVLVGRFDQHEIGVGARDDERQGRYWQRPGPDRIGEQVPFQVVHADERQTVDEGQ